jgi:lipopolysaccharide export LptBFGC system permease protein LptF
MKILDKYVAKNFLTGYLIAFFVLLGLRVLIDLFVNLDEFTEHVDLGTLTVIKNIASYYGLQITLYFRDFAGMITVVAAAFSLGRMVRNNELTAMMASGVSLKRVIAPIIVLSILLTGLLVVDQELIIPPLGDRLVREEDELPGEGTYDVWFLSDKNNSLICSANFDVATAILDKPFILLRKQNPETAIWQPSGWIEADSATYDQKKEYWTLENGMYTEIPRLPADSSQQPISPPENLRKPAIAYTTDLLPRDIPVLRKSENISMLPFVDLTRLQKQGTKIRDRLQLAAQKHFRVTDPLINLVLLMVCLPVLVCRDPRSMKSAVLVSFAITAACLTVTFACKLLATETVFGVTNPALWAWLPVFIFIPIAVLEVDAMKT